MFQFDVAIKKLIKNQQFRYLAVGGFNTLIGYFAFVAVQLSVGKTIGYLASLYVSHLIVSSVAFFVYRKHVFKVDGRILLDYGRYQISYLPGILINTLVLPVLVGLLDWNLFIAQGISQVVIAVGLYFAHRYFSFRRKAVGQTDAHSS